MANSNDTKDKATGGTSNPTIQQQSQPHPPPPYTGGSTTAKSSQEVNPEATEQTQLLSRTVTSYTTPYLSTPNLTYDSTNSNTIVVSPVLNLSALNTLPALTICPHCQRTVLSNVRYEGGGCTWLSCWVLGFLGAGPFCFLPFCVSICIMIIQNLKVYKY